MLALMGPSGAGKSTLLDLLAARKACGKLSGQVLVNGQTRNSGFVKQTAYVPQVTDSNHTGLESYGAGKLITDYASL